MKVFVYQWKLSSQIRIYMEGNCSVYELTSSNCVIPLHDNFCRIDETDFTANVNALISNRGSRLAFGFTIEVSDIVDVGYEIRKELPELFL